MKSRKQRILSIALVLAMLLAMFPTAAYAAGSGISVSQSAVKTGDTFTVSVQVPAISTNLSNFKLSVAFDKTAFELTAFAPVSLQNATLTSSTLAEAKTNGVYIASYLGNSGDNVIDLSSGYTLNATFRVLDSATAGRKNFSLVKSGSIACKFISLDRDGYTEIDHTPAGMAETVSVSVVSTISGALPISITAPVKGGTPQSTIADGMGYTGTITWEGSPAAFAASTAYTAVVELTAKSGYQFTNDVEPTVDGASSVTEKIVDADGSKLTFKAIFPKTAEADALSGSVLIAGIAKFGETLTADTSLLDYGSEDAGTLRYQWIRGGAEIRGATQRTYTLTAADVGNTIVVEVKNSNNSGRVISANTAIVAKADYSGAAATAATVSKTANSVTVTNVTSGQEYAITTGSSAPTEGWNPAGTFTGLNANTSYKVYTRVAATATTNASESVCTDVSTDKASGSITIAEPGTITYDGSAVEVGSGKDMNYSYTGDGAVTVKWYKDNSGSKGDELTGSTPKDAGTYWIGVSAAEGTNSAAVAEVTMKFTISPKALSNDMIELGTQNTYSGTEQGVAISAVKDGTTSLISSRDYEVKSGNKATNVGNNTLIIEGMGNYIGTASTSWTLVAKEVTLTWENYSSRTYGDGKTVTATVSNKVDTDEVNVTVSGGNETAVGSHTATATGLTGAQSGNYKLPTTTPTQNYDIGKAAAPTDVKADFEVLYNDTAEKAVTISNFNLPNDIANASFKDTATGKTGDDVIQSFENTKFVLKSGLTESNNGNTASWTVTIQSDNYGDITATVNVKVIKKHLNTTTLAVSQSNFTYGEGTDNPTVSNKPATAGTVTFSYSGRGTTAYGPASAAPTAAGDYTVTARCEDSEYIYTATADFTISKKSITGAEVTLGTALIYNGSSQTQGVTMVELDGTDIISFCTVSENAGTNAGDYTLKVTAKNASNYTGDVTKQFTIAKKSITPTIEVSGSYAYNNGVMILPNFTVKDGTATLAENDYAAVITDNVNAGSGKITVTETTTGNYTFSETQQSFTINKANYGNKTASGSAKYGTTGFVNLSGYLAEGGNFGTVTATDTNGVFSSTPAMDGNALKFTFVNEASKVSKTATITVPVTGATNYENYEINVTVTVTDKVTPTVTAPTAKTGLVYNGANQVLIDAGSVTGGTLQYSLTTGGDYSTGASQGQERW